MTLDTQPRSTDGKWSTKTGTAPDPSVLSDPNQSTPCSECGADTKRQSGLCRKCDPTRKTKKSKRQAAAESPGKSHSELFDQIEAGVAGLVSGGDWKRWLDVQSKFHNYSFSNTMLIMLQHPTATRVAGYRKWQDMDRQVKPGEKAIKILAPVIRKELDDDGNEKRQIRGFRGVNVFDVDQTEGEDLPNIAPSVEGDAPEHMVADLHRHAADLGASVSFVQKSDDPALRRGANGYASRDMQTGALSIVVSADIPPAQQAKTFAHEVGHIALGHLSDDPDHGGDIDTRFHKLRAERELEAESFAFMVSNGYGLATDDYSFGYTASWSNGDPKRVRAAAERIAKTAKKYMPAAPTTTDDGGQR